MSEKQECPPYRVLSAERDSRPQNGAWAPGNYISWCAGCGKWFIGDKRALNCAPCAYDETPTV